MQFHFRGKCGYKRHNSFSIGFEPIKITEGIDWKTLYKIKDDYKNFHGQNRRYSDYQNHEHKLLIVKKDNFYVTGTIDSQCAAHLKIKFYHNIYDKKKFNRNNPLKNMSTESQFFIWVCVGIGGFVMLILLSIWAKKRKNYRLNQRK